MNTLRLAAQARPKARLISIAILVAAAGLTACTSGSESVHLAGTDRPNVIVITLDTTRADALGAYGSERGLTPHLDRLAARSTVFEWAMTQAAVTPVSHASIFTGLFPFHHGLRVLHGQTDNRLSAEQLTLAEMLKEAGYSTGAFVSSFPVSERFGLNQGFDVFDATFDIDAERALGPGGTVSTGRAQRRGDETTDLALEWVARQHSPFLMWVHYFDPHDPIILPPRDYVESFGPLPQDELELFRELYAREVAYMDKQIGRLLEWLSASGQMNNTLIAVISDHGEGLGDHDWWTHGILYQEQVHAPFLWFDASRAPTRRPELVRSIDLVPTVLDRLDIPAPTLDGRSLLPLLNGASDWGEGPGYADSINVLTYSPHPRIRDIKDDVLFAVVEPPWKYIHHFREPDQSELYDLATDPFELENLFALKPEVVRGLRRRLSRWDVLPRRDQGASGEMSAEDERRLRSLGYVQ